MSESFFNVSKHNFCQRQREIWPDIIRIVAVFFVVLIHCAATGFHGRFPPNSSEFMACNFYNCLSRFCVPIFIMISGRFLLDESRDYSIKKLYCNKIFRMVLVYIFWSAIYSLVKQYDLYQSIHFNDFVYRIVKGHYHLWFLYMIVGLYMFAPVLRIIVKDESVCKYFIFVGVLCVLICNTIIHIPKVGGVFSENINIMNIRLFYDYSLYFVLGYWLTKHPLKKRDRKLLYVLGVISIASTILCNAGYSLYSGSAKEFFLKNLLPNTFLWTLSIFCFLQSVFLDISLKHRTLNLVQITAKYSFGIYLVHVLILQHLEFIGLSHFFIHPLFSIPIIAVLTFCISWIIVWGLHFIPIVNRYLI